MKRDGILLYGYYGAGNLGDDLLLAVLAAELRKIRPQARLLVRDHGDTEGLATLADRFGLVFTGIEAFLADQHRSKPARLLAYLCAYARLFAGCRWLIFGGGTLFHERGSALSLFLQFLICLVARLRGVRIAALGVGVAALPTPLGRWLLRRIVGLSTLFLVRDASGLEQCAGTKARISNDLVFSWVDLPELGERAGTGTIGLTVYPPSFAGPAGKDLIKALATAVTAWQAAGHRVVFLEFQAPGATAGDRAIFARIAAHLDLPAESRLLSAEPGALVRGLADIDLMCGMRFHGLVLAAMLDRPFCGLAHDNKTSDLCRRFHMPWLGVEALDAVDLVRAAKDASARPVDDDLVRTSAEQSRQNFRALAEAMGRT